MGDKVNKMNGSYSNSICSEEKAGKELDTDEDVQGRPFLGTSCLRSGLMRGTEERSSGWKRQQGRTAQRQKQAHTLKKLQKEASVEVQSE